MTAEHRSPATPNVGTHWNLDDRGTAMHRQIIGVSGYLFLGHGMMVISSRIKAEYRDKVDWHNHVSASFCSTAPKDQRRIPDELLDLVRRDFDMDDAEEDNHSSGIARHLFLPLWLPRGTTGICECKADESDCGRTRWLHVLGATMTPELAHDAWHNCQHEGIQEP